jgi:hypothetical protein
VPYLVANLATRAISPAHSTQGDLHVSLERACFWLRGKEGEGEQKGLMNRDRTMTMGPQPSVGLCLLTLLLLASSACGGAGGPSAEAPTTPQASPTVYDDPC